MIPKIFVILIISIIISLLDAVSRELTSGHVATRRDLSRQSI
jgi:hypothetical protein